MTGGAATGDGAVDDVARSSETRPPTCYTAPVGHRPRVQRAQHRGRDRPADAGGRPSPGSRSRGRRGRRRIVRRDRQGPRRPRGLHRPRRQPRHQPGQGCRHPHRSRGGRRRSRPRPGRGPRVRPRRLAPVARPGPEGKGPGRLRQPVHRRTEEHVPLALVGQPLPDARDQHPLPVDAVGHGDLLQALRPPCP